MSNDPYTQHGEENELDMDEELIREFEEDDPYMYEKPRYADELQEFVGFDGELHARVF